MTFRHALVLLIGYGTAVIASADSTRIAVVSSPEEKDFVAILTAELSANGNIAIVERDDLAKVGDEARLLSVSWPAPMG
jgi:hypothetical protein